MHARPLRRVQRDIIILAPRPEIRGCAAAAAEASTVVRVRSIEHARMERRRVFVVVPHEMEEREGGPECECARSDGFEACERLGARGCRVGAESEEDVGESRVGDGVWWSLARRVEDGGPEEAYVADGVEVAEGGRVECGELAADVLGARIRIRSVLCEDMACRFRERMARYPWRRHDHAGHFFSFFLSFFLFLLLSCPFLFFYFTNIKKDLNVAWRGGKDPREEIQGRE